MAIVRTRHLALNTLIYLSCLTLVYHSLFTPRPTVKQSVIAEMVSTPKLMKPSVDMMPPYLIWVGKGPNPKRKHKPNTPKLAAITPTKHLSTRLSFI